MENTSQLRWQYETIRHNGLLQYPYDVEAWKHFDNVYRFATSPQHVSLNLCLDGFPPYVHPFILVGMFLLLLIIYHLICVWLNFSYFQLVSYLVQQT